MATPVRHLAVPPPSAPTPESGARLARFVAVGVAVLMHGGIVGALLLVPPSVAAPELVPVIVAMTEPIVEDTAPPIAEPEPEEPATPAPEPEPVAEPPPPAPAPPEPPPHPVAAALERQKRYPESARARRATGVALLRFTVMRDGRVAGWRIERSAGEADLDQAVEAMIQQARLPAMPADMPGNSLMITVPIRFHLR